MLGREASFSGAVTTTFFSGKCVRRRLPHGIIAAIQLFNPQVIEPMAVLSCSIPYWRNEPAVADVLPSP
jgi:hypothetical protein